MRVADRMRRDAESVGPHDTVARAVRVLAQPRRGAVPVVSESTLVGVLDRRHVARALPSAATTLRINEIEGRLSRVVVGRILPATITAVGARTPLSEAIRLMRSRHAPLLPVTTGEEVVGVLTEEDLLDLLAEMLDGRPEGQAHERGGTRPRAAARPSRGSAAS